MNKARALFDRYVTTMGRHGQPLWISALNYAYSLGARQASGQISQEDAKEQLDAVKARMCEDQVAPEGVTLN